MGVRHDEEDLEFFFNRKEFVGQGGNLPALHKSGRGEVSLVKRPQEIGVSTGEAASVKKLPHAKWSEFFGVDLDFIKSEAFARKAPWIPV